MKVFLARVRETRGLRVDVERAYRDAAVARAIMDPGALDAAVSSPEAVLTASVDLEKVMSVLIPRLQAEVRGHVHPYGLGYTTAELDAASDRARATPARPGAGPASGERGYLGARNYFRHS